MLLQRNPFHISKEVPVEEITVLKVIIPVIPLDLLLFLFAH